MNSYENYSDEELLVRLRKGESDIQDYLMEKYKNLARSKARAMYLVDGDTDDLIQEAMIGLFKAIRDFSADHAASFSTFAHLCIDRQLYHAIEAANRKKNQPLNAYVSLSEENSEESLKHLWEESPESIVVGREHADDMMAQIRDRLSPFENHVLELYLRGNDYGRIAQMMDKSSKSIDNALQRIRAKVREVQEGMLSQEGKVDFEGTRKDG